MKRNVSTITLIALVAIGSSFVPASQAQNLLLNSSFESPGTSGNVGVGVESYDAPSLALTAWTVAGTGNVYLHKSPDLGDALGSTFNLAKDGAFYLDLSGSGAPHATIYQEFSTIPFATYTLSFYIGAATTPGPTINVQLTGATSLLNEALTPAAPATNITWTLKSFNFVADSTTTRLSFVGLSDTDDNASFVDNVAVVRVSQGQPVPASIYTAVEIAWSTIPGKTYQVQSTLSLENPSWANFGQSVNGNGAEHSVFDKTRDAIKRFYRVIEVQ